MKKELLQLSLGLMCTFCMSQVYGQESPVASGGEATGAGGTVSYSVGQVVYTSKSGSGGIVSEGVQQAYEIFTLDTKQTKFDVSLAAYPNPTRDILNLEISGLNKGGLNYHLYDAQGRLLRKSPINELKSTINTSDLEPSVYYLKVMRGKKLIQSFKIVKN